MMFLNLLFRTPCVEALEKPASLEPRAQDIVDNYG